MLSSRAEIERIRNSLVLTAEVLAAQLVVDVVGHNPIKLAHLAIRLPAVVSRIRRLITACEAMIQQFASVETKLVAGMALEVGTVTGFIANPPVEVVSQRDWGASKAPSSLSEFAARLNRLDNRGLPEIRIERYPGAAIAYIPGTQSASFGWTGNPMDMKTNLQGLAGKMTSVELGLAKALKAAGVSPTDRVMLVGHSQGGMIALNAASHSNSKLFPYSVEKVITFGSPVGANTLNQNQRVLAVENSADFVPKLDASRNPSTPNRLSFERNMPGDVVSAHQMETYQEISLQIDSQESERIAEFTNFTSGEAQVTISRLGQGNVISGQEVS